MKVIKAKFNGVESEVPVAEEIYNAIRNELIDEIYNLLDEGVCDYCDCRDFDNKCYKNCQEEKYVVMKLVKEKNNE